jgi:prepilin-type N-terminal cleavage/methylation domain-containing protein
MSVDWWNTFCDRTRSRVLKLEKRRAFTLVELLIVLAVVSVLAAVLFPVFSQAKRAALQASCLGRFRQVTTATHMYLMEYDDEFMPINYQPGLPPNAKTDRTWVQMLLPYTESFRTLRCPADSENVDQSVSVFDQDLVPGDLFPRYYTSSMHVNVGYNFQYLSPSLKDGNNWTSQPKNYTDLADPSQMLLFVDSAWRIENGVPVDGGSWLVSPPCRYQNVGGAVMDTIASKSVDELSSSGTEQIYAPTDGWQPASPSGRTYGGAWPWHSGRLTVATVGGSVRPITIAELGSGCDIQPGWGGEIQNRSKYLWSPQ